MAKVITQELLRNGLFSVDIWFWKDDIQTQSADYPDLIAKHFPEFKEGGRQLKGYPRPRMDTMKYFVYLDILGIEELTEEIEEDRGIGEKSL